MLDFSTTILILPVIETYPTFSIPGCTQRPIGEVHVYGHREHNAADGLVYCEGCGAASDGARVMYISEPLKGQGGFEGSMAQCSTCMHDLYDTVVHCDRPWMISEVSDASPIVGRVWPAFPTAVAPQMLSGLPGGKWGHRPGGLHKCSHGFSVHGRCPVMA